MSSFKKIQYKSQAYDGFKLWGNYLYYRLIIYLQELGNLLVI